MLDRRTPEDACATNSPNGPYGTGEKTFFIYGISSKIYIKGVKFPILPPTLLETVRRKIWFL